MIMVASSGTCGRFLDDFEVVRVITDKFFCTVSAIFSKIFRKK